ncbi:cytochrome P450 [Amycolatopsis sp. GM8]|uniref:cytochrome P450 n=1 Tax=Amycolatopsis sp. GM8 TaxID=2896530 RepID=UPI001F1C1C54|nr:cytochrome P450 [Amycolatopsis sp. GM8]
MTHQINDDHRLQGTPHGEWLSGLTVPELDAQTDEIFTRLRKEQPVAWVPALGAWFVSNWELCREVATNAEDFPGGTNVMEARLFGTPLILGAEGATHADLRLAVGGQFQAKSFKHRLEERIRPLAREQCAKLDAARGCELMHDYFEPVSVLSVADALGFRDLTADTLQRWFHTLALGSANITDENGEFLDPHGFDDADVVREEVRAYLTELHAGERENPTDGPVGQFFRAGLPEGEMRDVEYLLPSTLVLFLGGLQEPGHACGTTFLGLTTRPEQMRRVIENPGLLQKAIAEGLRWMSPLYGGASRTAARDLSVGGQDVKAGDHLWLIYGSANVDESEFDDGGLYDLDRERHPNLAFGIGRHSCVGSAYAPQVARIALDELFQAFPDIRLDPEQPPNPAGWLFRGARELHALLR